MRHTGWMANWRSGFIAGLAMAVVLWWTAVGWAQGYSADPVEGLRQALRTEVDPTNPASLEARRTSLERRAAALISVSELRRALTLQEWRDEEPEPNIAKIDGAVRTAIADRLEKAMRRALTSNQTEARLGAVIAIGEMGASVRGTTGQSSFARRLAPDLLRLVEESDSPIREAAALAVSKLYPDPDPATHALGDMLKSGTVIQRRAAAEALGNMIQVAINLAKVSNTTGVRTTRVDVVRVARDVLREIGPGLRDPDVGVRRWSLQGIQGVTSTFGLTELLGGPFRTEELARVEEPQKIVGQERSEFLPLAQALREVAPAVAGALSDAEPDNRLRAASILEGMGFARYRLLRRAASTSVTAPQAAAPGQHIHLVSQKIEALPAPEKVSPNSPEQQLLEGLRSALPALARATQDPDWHVRLAAIDALETMENDAAPAIPAMIQALGDSNLFVRWAAARTIGKIEPARITSDQMTGVMTGLTQLLRDEDLSVQLAAASALERYGPTAGPASAALGTAVTQGDPEIRVAAAHALGSIGMSARVAIPDLIRGLSDPDARVRQAAAETLGKFGPAAASAAPALRQALQDSEPDVRRAASDALLDIVVPPKREL